jgi:N-acetyltransferase
MTRWRSRVRVPSCPLEKSWFVMTRPRSGGASVASGDQTGSVPTPLPLVTLTGTHVRLEPLSLDHVTALAAAADGPRDTFGLTWVPDPTERSAQQYVEHALAAHAAGTALPFATVRTGPGDPPAGRVVGSTRFLNVEHWDWPASIPVPPEVAGRSTPHAVEIGATWLTSAAQRTAVNTEAKLLMLDHAFDVWRCHRVSLRTDERNARSRANIERVGARFEGVLRNHMYAYDGGLRSTAVYSLLPEDWPAARAALVGRLRD